MLYQYYNIVRNAERVRLQDRYIGRRNPREYNCGYLGTGVVIFLDMVDGGVGWKMEVKKFSKKYCPEQKIVYIFSTPLYSIFHTFAFHFFIYLPPTLLMS